MRVSAVLFVNPTHAPPMTATLQLLLTLLLLRLCIDL